ncbi:hypothetical protein SCLCIDRAFT_1220268, partial [Scleroderma citrinum Foug A]
MAGNGWRYRRLSANRGNMADWREPARVSAPKIKNQKLTCRLGHLSNLQSVRTVSL